MDHTVCVPKTLSCRASVAHRVSAQPPWLRVVSIFLLQEKNVCGATSRRQRLTRLRDGHCIPKDRRSDAPACHVSFYTHLPRYPTGTPRRGRTHRQRLPQAGHVPTSMMLG